MTCCSAYDVQRLTSPLAKSRKKAAKKLAARDTAGATVVAAPSASDVDCRNGACFNDDNHRQPCRNGMCMRDEHGKPAEPHKRPRCPKHPNGHTK